MAEKKGQDNLLKGRPHGSKNKRTVEGEDFARDIVVQDDEDILITSEPVEVPGEKGPEVVAREVEHDRHARAVTDPVYRALRRQARNGVGNLPGQLPPAVFSALADRAFGKVVDRLKVTDGRPLANETEEELLVRLRELESTFKSAERIVA